MSEKLYTKAQLKEAAKSAFESGVNWATAYSGWFSPSNTQHKQERQKAIRAAVTAADEAQQPPSEGEA